MSRFSRDTDELRKLRLADNIVCSATVHNVAHITEEDWNIILELGPVARRAWAYSLEDSDHQRHVTDALIVLERTACTSVGLSGAPITRRTE